jgi:RNA-directed DNA polymerase
MNAVRHVGKEVVLTADLSDFFGTISLSDVMVLFENLGAERPASTVLARLCTIDERLMQGGRASAAIANLVAQRLDSIILREIDSEAVYTRYVDDITISGPAVAIPSIQRLTAWIESAGFMLRPGSAIRKARSAGPFVTGLNVGGDWPRVPRKLRRRIERYLRFAADPRFDEESAAARTFKRGRLTDPSTARAYIRGMANWVRSIDEELARRWDLKLDALSEEDSQH